MANVTGGVRVANFSDPDNLYINGGTRGFSGNDFTPIQQPRPIYNPREVVATSPDFRAPRQTETRYLSPIRYRNNNFRLSDYVGSGAVRSLLFAGVMVAIVCGVLAATGTFKGIDSN
ncbi:MAG TPA: hypothetical protein DHW71_12410 [Gammaproteobacteria bacterium]|nr:hypothetical protein [Gammaproteobacteria bacterium]HBF07144.1 hypothetical protein [Gammaproteobacteria bacterium]HCK93791.1 hypothetical protein [Gammaproteobacteria bacterium]|tara:strand:+ start:174 stop:524 length:351 start_codon:yes stop_codon:yes gene_type:complete